ncbi:MAG TPA: SDR family NAD(P)-dependent oxidoreductase [Solirubrobacteraceae bacterium]|jgi:NADP-dependent 3-hydroxy acid dehydrogenase YdfG|nr:SDR family NAD(P)-dependent oxidoreductase [Solirubrobacteraceae bacterium]
MTLGLTDVNGKVAAITGASSGIGEATARVLAGAGVSVALGARRVERIEALAREINDGGGRAVAIPTDVTRESEARRFIEQTHEELGGLDVLVNNAGMMLLGPIDGAPLEEWRQMIDVNVMGVLYCTHAAVPLMRERGGGHIVMVSSVGGRVIGKYSGVYNLTKFGLGAFSEALRQESQADGLRVTVIEPGRAETELRDHIRREVLEQIGGAFSQTTPLEGEEIANAILWSIAQPANVNVSELLVRPLISPM